MLDVDFKKNVDVNFARLLMTMIAVLTNIVKTMMFTMMVTLSGSPPKSAMWSWIHSRAKSCKLALDFYPLFVGLLLNVVNNISRCYLAREAQKHMDQTYWNRSKIVCKGSK